MSIKPLSLLLISIALFLTGFVTILHEIDQENSILYVEGKGYPPIKSENPAQARLMARRAAVLDAYRNILNFLGSGKDYPLDETEVAITYGYIRGAQVMDEILLSDGGVKVRVAYPLSPQEIGRLEKKGYMKSRIASAQVQPKKSTLFSEPVAVDLETWIERLKEERQRVQKEVGPKSHKFRPAPIVVQTIREVKGVHPVTLEEWTNIIKGMKKN